MRLSSLPPKNCGTLFMTSLQFDVNSPAIIPRNFEVCCCFLIRIIQQVLMSRPVSGGAVCRNIPGYLIQRWSRVLSCSRCWISCPWSPSQRTRRGCLASAPSPGSSEWWHLQSERESRVSTSQSPRVPSISTTTLINSGSSLSCTFINQIINVYPPLEFLQSAGALNSSLSEIKKTQYKVQGPLVMQWVNPCLPGGSFTASH